MPRLPRIHVEGSLYYITCQSHHSNELFKDSKDYNKYFNLLAAFKNKHQFKLFSYCLLSDKVYLLIGIKSESSISEVMFNLNSSYTKYYNSRHGKKGPVLEGRFKSKWVEKKTYLLPLTRYIHLLSKQKDYIYSSYSVFLGKSADGIRNIPMADEIQETISYLPANTDYKTYVEKVDLKELKDLGQKLARNRFLGSKEFEQKVKTAIKTYKENKKNKVTIEKVVLQKRIPKHLPCRPARSDLPAKDWQAGVTSRAGGFEKYQRGLLWGGVGVTVLLLLLAGYFYNRQNLWKEELARLLASARSGQEITQKEFNQKLAGLEQSQIHSVDSLNINGVQSNLPDIVSMAGEQIKEKSSSPQHALISDPLEGAVWEVKLGPISSEVSQKPQVDILKFKEGRFVSNILTKEGFGPSNYSLMYKDKGVIVWETMQSGDGGAIASWHGKWNGEVMKGVLSQKFPGKEAKTFSFTGYMKTST